MARYRKEIQYEKVFYQRNVDLGIDPECHECTSHGINKLGYPTIGSEGITWHLHRYMYVQFTGEKPPVVMHLCDNRKCINLLHLKGGTQRDNVQDMIKKGRKVTSYYDKKGKKVTHHISDIHLPYTREME